MSCCTCPLCKLRVKMVEQLISDIPDYQLHPCPPFTHVSLDLDGPYSTKAMGNSSTLIKSWGLDIACQNTLSFSPLSYILFSKVMPAEIVDQTMIDIAFLVVE